MMKLGGLLERETDETSGKWEHYRKTITDKNIMEGNSVIYSLVSVDSGD